jgi:hypothetical protein
LLVPTSRRTVVVWHAAIEASTACPVFAMIRSRVGFQDWAKKPMDGPVEEEMDDDEQEVAEDISEFDGLHTNEGIADEQLFDDEEAMSE